MTAIEHIQAAQRMALVDEDGDKVSLELSPPISAEQINEVQRRAGMTLPEELRALLGFCSKIDGGAFEMDFTSETMDFGHEEVFPHGHPIAADGFGNFWVLDLTPETKVTAPVFFACHDAPVVLYQSPDLASFLGEVFKMNVPPHQSLVDDVHEDRLFNVWGKNPGVIEHAAAIASPDPALQAFASGLPGEFQFIDLRSVPPGMGFSWGRYGPRTELRRHGYEQVFAYAKPPKRGLLATIFGR